MGNFAASVRWSRVVPFALVGIMLLASLHASRSVVQAAGLCVNTGGTGGCFSKIQDAINTATSGDTIKVAAGTYNEHLAISGKNLTIVGAAGTIVDGTSSGTVLFLPDSGVTIVLSNLTLTNGSNRSPGGGIQNHGTLALDHVTLSHSNSIVAGGIFNQGMLTMTNSTVSDNTADGDAGIDNVATLVITNSTIGGNTASVVAGGLGNSGTATLRHVTIANNVAGANGGGGIGNGSGGTVTMANTIVANNAAPVGPDVSNVGTVVSQGYNLIGNTSGGSGFVTSDLLNLDPKLGPLTNNGGLTQTMAPQPGSPAIDVIPPAHGCNGAGVTTDQRGVSRPQGVACDIGAVEVKGTPPSLLVGDKTVEYNVNPNVAGTAEAFQYTAKNGGTATTLSLYLDGSSTATQVVVGLYANTSKNSPGALLAQATITTPIAGAWNAVTISGTAITDGGKYWIAVLGPAGLGTVVYRDRTASGKSELSQETNLTALPATWTPGQVFDSAPMSAYAI